MEDTNKCTVFEPHNTEILQKKKGDKTKIQEASSEEHLGVVNLSHLPYLESHLCQLSQLHLIALHSFWEEHYQVLCCKN